MAQFSCFWSSLEQENGIVSKLHNMRSYKVILFGNFIWYKVILFGDSGGNQVATRALGLPEA